MKILMTGRFIAPSGVARATKEIINAFKKHHTSDTLSVFAFDDKTRFEGDKNVSIQTVETHPEYVRTPICGLSSISELRARYRRQIEFAFEFLDRVTPDVVVLNGTNVHDWVLMQAVGNARIPTVVIMHSAFRERLRYVDTPQQRLQAELETRIAEQCTRFVFVSPFVRELFTSRYEVVPESHVIIPNGIPDAFFLPCDYEPNRFFDIGFIGRDDPVKNLEFFRHLSEHTGMVRHSVHVLTDFAHNAMLIPGFTKRGIHLLPPTIEDDFLMKIYRATRVVVSPSHFETLGLVPLEALACGSAAVVSKNMGVAHYFKQLGLEEWIIDFSDVKNAIERILHLLSMPLSVADTVRKRLRKEHAWSATSGKFIEFFKSGNIGERDFEAVPEPRKYGFESFASETV